MPLIRIPFLLFFLFSGILFSGCRDGSDLALEDLQAFDFFSRPSPLQNLTPLLEIPEKTEGVEYISLKVQLYDARYETSANLIILGNGETILVDYSDAKFIKESMIPYLKRREIEQIDHLINTHFHKGSVDAQRGDGLDVLMTEFSVKKIYSASLTKTERYSSTDQQIIQTLVTKAREYNVIWQTVSAGDRLSFWEGQAHLEILSDSNHESPEPSTLNLRFEYQDFSIFFLQSTRDEDILELANRQSNVASTVLVLPHSPSNYNIYDALYEAIDPVMMIIPYSLRLFDKKEANQIHLQFLQEWQNRGVLAFPAGRHGNISVQTDGKTASYYTDRAILLGKIQPQPTLFTDVTKEAGLNGRESRGIWGDFDGDGDEDYYTSTNNGDGTFSKNKQLDSIIENGRGISWGDLNSDGRLDLFGTYYQSSTRLHPYVEQQSDGTFIQKFQDYFEGLQQNTTIEEWSGETNAWADIDGDGDLDIFVPWYHYQDPGGSFLLINNYPILTEEGHKRGVAPPLDNNLWPRVEGVHFADLNNDDYLDLYTTSQLFLNDGRGYFTDHREEWGAPVTFDEGISFLDLDIDGDLDLFINAPKPYLLRNVGGRFEDISWESGIEALEVIPFYWYHVFFDLDLDGDPDLIWRVANPETKKLSLYYLENQGNGLFTTPRLLDEVGHDGGLGVADYDLDGDLDLGIGGGILWKNNWMENHPETPKPMRIKVISPRGHFTEFGASVLVFTYDENRTLLQQQVQVTDGGSGYLQQNQYPLHFPVQPSRFYAIEVRPPTGIQRGSRRFRTNLISGATLIGKTVIIGESGIQSIETY